MINKFEIAIFLILNLFINTNCAGIYLCTGANKVGCSLKPGGWNLLGPKCFQTDGHVSGYAVGKNGCYIYSSNDCVNTQIFVDQAGWSKFPFTPKSYKCLDAF